MPTFNQNILNGFVEVFAEQTEVLVEQLKKVAGKGEFDIYDYVSKCTLDTFCGKMVLLLTEIYLFIYLSFKKLLWVLLSMRKQPTVNT